MRAGQSGVWLGGTGSAAIVEAGAVPLLVALLAAGATSRAARNAAGALANLAAWLGGTERSDRRGWGGAAARGTARSGSHVGAAQRAAIALCNLIASVDGAQHATAALTISTLRRKAISTSGFGLLQSRLQPAARARLSAATEGVDCTELKEALQEARLVEVEEPQLAAAQARLDELAAAAAAAKRARRESVGLGNVQPPAEFMCPLTFDVMVDPVVASDGHSYERAAIGEVLSSASKLSPLTREPLTDALVPNRALRSRIEEHDAELDRMAEQMEARMEAAAAEFRAEAAMASGRRRRRRRQRRGRQGRRRRRRRRLFAKSCSSSGRREEKGPHRSAAESDARGGGV